MSMKTHVPRGLTTGIPLPRNGFRNAASLDVTNRKRGDKRFLPDPPREGKGFQQAVMAENAPLTESTAVFILRGSA